MDAADALLLALLVIAAAGWLVAIAALRRARVVATAKRSQSARYGGITEQFAPWMDRWPFASREGFKFLGKPVDGIQFEDDAVYLVEIKAVGSRLSTQQRAVRDAVLAGRVGWVEFYASEAREAVVIRPWEKGRP